MGQLIPIALITLISGCFSKSDETNLPTDDGGALSESGWYLELIVDSEQTIAGQAVSYTPRLLRPNGSEVVADWYEMTSDLEPGFLWSPDVLTPTIAGTHTLTLSVDIDGDILQDTAPLTVTPADVYDIDLNLSDLSVSAGSSVTWTVDAVDQYGNTVDATSTIVTSNDPDMNVEDSELWTTIPGNYLAIATIEKVEDIEMFVVTADSAASLSLTMTTPIEQYETVTANVEIFDAYGNPADDNWTLTTEGDGNVAMSQFNLTFNDEGWYTVTASVDGSELSDSVGPFLVDSHGPLIEITQPQRGEWIEETSTTVSGVVTDEWSALAALDVNGNQVEINNDGSFSTTLNSPSGIRIIETTATDTDGNTSIDTRSIIANDYANYGDFIADGVVVRIHEGPGGLDTLEEMGESLIDNSTLTDLISNPVVNEQSVWQECINPCGLWGGNCQECWSFTWYALQVNVTNPSFGSASLNLNPKSNGRIKATFIIYDVSLYWYGNAVVTEIISASDSGNITANNITVEMEIQPYVTSNDNIAVSVYGTSVATSNFNFNMDSILDDAAEFFGINVDGLVEGFIVDALEAAVEDEVPALLDDALTDLELDYEFDVNGQEFDLVAKPHDISIDSTGITLSLQTQVLAQEWNHDDAGIGSVYAGYAMPSWNGSPGTIVGVSTDFLNQMMYAVWGSGLLDIDMAGEDLGLDNDAVSILFPDATSIAIQVDPMLPPTIVPSSGTGLLDLQLGDLGLSLFNGDPLDQDLRLSVYSHVMADLNIGVGSDQTLNAELGSMDLYFDALKPQANSIGAANTEAILAQLLPMLLPSLTEALGSFEIPSIEGLSLTNIAIDGEGQDNAFITLGGDLE